MVFPISILKAASLMVIKNNILDSVGYICQSQASLSGLGARSTLDREFDRSFERDFSSRREFEKDFSRREFEKDFSRLDSDLNFSSGLGARSALSDLEHDLKFSSLASRARTPLSTSHSGSSSTYKAEKYSSSTSSTNGGLPHR